jgi:hypothetical protein
MSRPSLTSALNLSIPLDPLPKSFWLWGTHAPSLWAETKPGIYSGMPHATLEESYLIMASNDCFSFPPSSLVNGTDLEAQVMAHPSGVCHASRLCLPLPYLRCQLTFSVSSMVSPHVLCLCLPCPPWAYWDPASHEKLQTLYLMT